MPLLAYCIAETRAIKTLPAGIDGLPIQGIQAGKLHCFVSEIAIDSLAGTTSLKEAAIQFNRTLQDFLKQATIVPFRFPTMLNENELIEHLTQHALQYEEALVRLRGMVQMDIRIEARQAKSETFSSGTEYLRLREARLASLHDIAAQFRSAGQPWIREWREHEMSRGLHCHVLLPREQVDSFLGRTRGLSIASEYRARVSGPWPPAEFLKN